MGAARLQLNALQRCQCSPCPRETSSLSHAGCMLVMRCKESQGEGQTALIVSNEKFPSLLGCFFYRVMHMWEQHWHLQLGWGTCTRGLHSGASELNIHLLLVNLVHIVSIICPFPAPCGRSWGCHGSGRELGLQFRGRLRGIAPFSDLDYR